MRTHPDHAKHMAAAFAVAMMALSFSSGCPIEFVAKDEPVVGDEPETPVPESEPAGNEPEDSGISDAGAVEPDDGGNANLDAGEAQDAGPFDAGDADAGVFDAGVVDAGVDAGDIDAGDIDAGDIDIDAGVVDAGLIDAGAGIVDAGPVCGNGSVEFGETCDDQNTADGDGCDEDCALEPPAICTAASDVELAINGGFLAGGFGFSSDAQISNQLGCDLNGPKALVAYVNESEAHLETTGDGIVLIFDDLTSDQTVLWSQDFALQAGNAYRFRVDIGRIGGDPAPEVSIVVNGTEIGRLDITAADAPTQALANFLAPAESVTIEILSHTESCIGNNPTLDGISLRENSLRSFCHQCGDGILGGGETCDEGIADPTDACDEECVAQPSVACAVAGTPCVTSTSQNSFQGLLRRGGRGIDVQTTCDASEMLVGFDTWASNLFGTPVLGSMEAVCAQRVVDVDGTLSWTNPQPINVSRGDQSATRIETRCPPNTFARGTVSQLENVSGYVVHTGLQFVCQGATLSPIGIVAAGPRTIVETSVGALPFSNPLLCDDTRWPLGMNFGIGQVLDSVQVTCVRNTPTLSQVD